LILRNATIETVTYENSRNDIGGNRDARLEDFEFQHSLRRYQEQIIELCNKKLATGERELHIVAPPGSGKTIIGLQIIAQLKRPSLVLCPNSTIQAQWSQKLELFLRPEALAFKGRDLVGSNEDRPLKPITVLTYQSLTVPGRESEYISQLSRTAWENEIVNNRVVSTADAIKRIDEIKSNNSSEYKKEIGRHAARLRRKLADVLELEKVLHPNALEMIERLREENCSLVIFDECHHLTDYWSAVMIQLIRKLNGPLVVGLTGTPPATKNALQKNRYLTLVGPIDYQVPTPALVKEGGLAAFQDLVYFTEPSAREREFLNSQHKEFREILLWLANSNNSQLSAWISKQIHGEGFGDSDNSGDGAEFRTSDKSSAPEQHGTSVNYFRTEQGDEWLQLVESNPELAIAMARYLWKFKLPLPEGLHLSESVRQSPLIDDWMRILEAFSLNSLKPSADENDRELLRKISTAIKKIGFVLSERGIKKVASPVDRVLAFSQTKSLAVANILDTEYRSLESRLRAIVVTDFEKMSATVAKSINEVMDAESGGALGVMHELLMQPISEYINPCLVTGSLVLIDKRIEQEFLVAANTYLHECGSVLDLRCEAEESSESHGRCLRVLASGQWNPRVYVALMTELFERGITKCLIGTRGIFGEGWDSQQLNTIIDLTTSTSVVSVNQLRGRGIRLNEKDPLAAQKVANNWDVVCIAPELEKGLNDYLRFVRKHEGYFGISDDGQIECGVGHVHPSFSELTPAEVFASIEEFNHEMLQRALIRDQIYELWQVGKPYVNRQVSCVEISGLRQIGVTPPHIGMTNRMLPTVSGTQAQRLTSSQMKSIEEHLPGDINGIEALSLKPVEEHAKQVQSSIVSTWTYFIGIATVSSVVLGLILANFSIPIFIAAVSFIPALIAAKNKTGMMRTQLNEMLSTPASQEEVLVSFGTAILVALQSRKFLPSEIRAQSISVSIRSDGSIRVFLDNVEPNHCEVFVHALEEVLAPITNQPYLVPKFEYRVAEARSDEFISSYLTGNAKPSVGSYHAVPRILARSEKGREAFELAWNEYVSPGFVLSTFENPSVAQEYFGMGPSLAEKVLWE
jgi:superfamily II DNA or RNA helicase